MTLQQKSMDVIGCLPEDKIIQVIQFAEFLPFDKKPQREKAYLKEISKDDYIRKSGILKRKMVMADDFDETPECFKKYM
ncbi:DUF2281 domain-containing protein [Lachnospiraceae bacterium 47-T17]